MTDERERDDAALIEEMAETLREARDARNPPLLSKIDALLARLQPPAEPEPDRAEVLWGKLSGMMGDYTPDDALGWINEAFDELRAEIEAERLQKEKNGMICEDEGCPHFDLPHSHAERSVIDVPGEVRCAMEVITNTYAKTHWAAHRLARFVKQLTEKQDATG